MRCRHHKHSVLQRIFLNGVCVCASCHIMSCMTLSFEFSTLTQMALLPRISAPFFIARLLARGRCDVDRHRKVAGFIRASRLLFDKPSPNLVCFSIALKKYKKLLKSRNAGALFQHVRCGKHTNFCSTACVSLSATVPMVTRFKTCPF